MGIENLQQNRTIVSVPSELDRIRFPEQIFTNGYLNDPIKFRPDSRFTQRSLVQQLNVLPNLAKRDFANFVQAEANNSTKQYFAINTYASVWDRNSYLKIVSSERRTFNELGQ